MAGETVSPRERRASQSGSYLESVPSAHELYQKHARHIGRFHGISGMDHLQLSIFSPPPPWRTSDPPISPSHAKRLYDEDFDHALAEDCQRALPSEHVTEEAREREKGEQATAWRARMALNELVREHRCEVWYDWLNLLKREEKRKEMAKEIAQKWEREQAMMLEKDLTPSPPEPGGVQSPGREKRGGRLRQVPVTTRRLRPRTTENRTPQAVRAGNALIQMSEEERAEGWQPLADIGSNDDMQELISTSMQGAYGRLQNGTEELKRKKQMMERALNAVLSQSHTLPRHSNLPDNPRLQDACLRSQTYDDGAHQETQVGSQPYAGLGQGASYSEGIGPYSTQRAAIHSILDETTAFGRALTSSEAIGAPSADGRSLSGSSFGPLLSGQVAALYQGKESGSSSAAGDIIFKPKRKRVHPNTTPRPPSAGPRSWLSDIHSAPPPPPSTISPEALQAGLDWRQQNAATEAAASAILDSASTTPTPKSRGKGKSTASGPARTRAPPKPRASRRGANPPIDTLIGLPISDAAAKHLVDNGMIKERSRRQFDADVTPRKGFRLEVGAGPAAILQTAEPDSTPKVSSGPSVGPGTASGFSTRPAPGGLASLPPAIQWQTPERMATPRPDASSEMSSAPSGSDESPLGKRARRVRLSPW